MRMFTEELAAESKILPIGRWRRFKFILVPFSRAQPQLVDVLWSPDGA